MHLALLIASRTAVNKWFYRVAREREREARSDTSCRDTRNRQNFFLSSSSAISLPCPRGKIYISSFARINALANCALSRHRVGQSLIASRIELGNVCLNFACLVASGRDSFRLNPSERRSILSATLFYNHLSSHYFISTFPQSSKCHQYFVKCC